MGDMCQDQPMAVSNIWLRTALTSKMIGVLVLCLAAAAVCVRLGYWQVERATSRGADRIITEHNDKIASDPVPLSEVIGLQQRMTTEEYARPVYVSGTFDDDQLRVINRSVDGQSVDIDLAPLRTADGIVPVARGWVLQGQDLPALPAGEVTVYGYLSGPEDSIGGLTGETALSISAGELVNRWGGPILSGYLVEFGETTTGDLETRGSVEDGYLPAPKPTEEGGFNLQNAAYAIEWIIFAGFFIFLYIRMLRSEVATAKEDELLEAYL